MSPEDKKTDYKKQKPIVIEVDGVTFSIISYEIESSKEAEGFVDVVLTRFGFRAKKDSKRKVIASVVSDPRLPIKGPFPIPAWREYLGTLLLNKGEITEHIAEKVTLESGFTTSSSDVVLSPVYRDLPKDKAQAFIRNSEKIHPKLTYEERPPESGNPNAVDIVAYLSEDIPPSTENCQVCGAPLPYLSNKCTKCGTMNFT